MSDSFIPIPGYPGYFANPDGRIRGRSGKVLKPVIQGKGYAYVCVKRDNGRLFNRRVHGLIAETFLGPRPDGCHVNHKNGERADNRAANLEYVSNRANVIHGATTTGLPGVIRDARYTGRCWRAAAHNKGERVSLGYHNTKEEAFVAYLTYLAEIGDDDAIRYATRALAQRSDKEQTNE